MPWKRPCKDCQKRRPACHGKCEDYAAFLEDHRARVDYCRAGEADAFTRQEVRKNKRRNAR